MSGALPPTMLCPHCGTANRSGSNFCNRCGASLRTEGGPPPFTGEETGGGAPASADPPGTVGTAPDAPAPQPWLEPGFVGEDDLPPEPPEDVDAGVADTTDIPVAAGRLVSGIQGLIEPIRVATVPGESDGEPPAEVVPGSTLDADGLRRVRALMAEEPLLAAAVLPQGAQGALPPRRHPSLWAPWLFLLLGLAVGLAVFLQPLRLTGVAQAWPGVGGAFAAIDALPPQAAVQVFWAYDPATAGELDLVAAPIVRHLLDQGVTLQVVSLLPNGPATARRLIAAVHDERMLLRRGLGEAPVDGPYFLPGGEMVLPAAAGTLGFAAAPPERPPFGLAVVFAAEAEDVQAWLEQVAARTGVPVVAATGAGADPLLRPYLASGQLVGLVSGFDGAATYTSLLDELPAPARERQLDLQLVGQNFGGFIFLLAILLGNLAILLMGRRGDA